MKITLSDGSSFSMPETVQRDAGIFAGGELSPERIRELQRRSELRHAEERAFSLLARGPHTREGLRLKLFQREISPAAVEHALSRMQELGYLNDLRFAEDWLQSRMRRHPEGRWALLAGLRKRGVGRQTAEEAISRTVSEEAEIRAARQVLERLSRSGSPERAAAKLAARGFTRPVVNRVLDQPPD